MAEQDDPRIGPDARDDATAAKVVSDTDRPVPPGGGSLGGASAAGPLDQPARGGSGTAPDSPIDTDGPPPEGSPNVIGHEAALRAAGDAPEDEPPPR